MEKVVEIGAGLDVHKKRVAVCCIDGRSNPAKRINRSFGTFRHELEQMREWLKACGCTHVAMESTGVYWMAVYRVLEGHFTIVLGNARHMANVPGRKTDVLDAEWIAVLLQHGLIRPNFVPPEAFRQLRQLTRYRRKLVQMRTASQLRVEKLLQASNIKLSSVASEIFGVSGRLMLGALADGNTNPDALAELSRGKLRKKRPDLRLALDGAFSEQDAELLKIQLAVIDEIEDKLRDLEFVIDGKLEPYTTELARLQTIPGVGRRIATDILAEIGVNPNCWPTEHHFAAWSGTAPGNRESAGVRRRAKSRDGDIYLKSILCQAAAAASRTRGSYLAARYRRVKSRRGERRALLMVAHEIAISIYHMMRRGEDYRQPAAADPKIAQQRVCSRYIRELQKLGYEVSPRKA